MLYVRVVAVVRSGFLCAGGGSLCWSAVVCLQFLGAREGWGFYGRWVFMRVSRLRLDIRFDFRLSLLTGCSVGGIFIL